MNAEQVTFVALAIVCTFIVLMPVVIIFILSKKDKKVIGTLSTGKNKEDGSPVWRFSFYNEDALEEIENMNYVTFKIVKEEKHE